MRPAEVLDHRADLIVRMEDPFVRRLWVEQLTMDHHSAMNRRTSRTTLGDEQIKANAAAMVRSLWDAVHEAEAYHVTPDMTMMVQHAADGLEMTDRIDRTVLPTRSGLARFEKGLEFTDVRGRLLVINWLAWGPLLYRDPRDARHDAGEPDQAIGIWMWNDHVEEPDVIATSLRGDLPEYEETIARHIGRWGLIGNEVLYDGMRLGPARIEVPEDKAEQVLADGDTPTAYSNTPRLAHAFWLLLNQTVTRLRPEDVDRARRKRAERRGLPSRVTIIELRRTAGSNEPGESLIDWSHRWLVRGHWRWQPCGDKHPYAQEIAPGKYAVRIWIAPYVKGPEDKPLVVTDKVYALKR